MPVPNKGALLALDISKRAIGIAVCDEDRLIATPLSTIQRRKWQNDLTTILELAKERRVCAIVVGEPLNMDGSAGPAAQSRRDLARLIQQAAPGLAVLMQDERLTTDAIKDAFAEGRWRRPKQGPLDHFAAAIILEDAMRRLANEGGTSC